MSGARPLLSVCIPTFNRAALLEYALDNLRALERFAVPFEIVVSDNCSTDPTAEVVARHARASPHVRFFRQSRATPPSGGLMNAAHNARGKFVVFLADDDSVIADALMRYVERMERQDDLAAVFCDWIAYDDAQGRELHRYFGFREPAEFGPQDPLRLVEFVLRNAVFPEVALYRREMLLRSLCLVRRSDYFAHLWMYHLSRLGRIAFELEPYYREHRVLRPEFGRSEHRSSWSMRWQLIGDELRNELEALVLLALQDAGVAPNAIDGAAPYRRLIDRFLHSRLPGEIGRARGDGDWLLATELQRRWTLWNDPASAEEQRNSFYKMTLPAALQHVAELYRTLSGVTGLVLRGFASRRVHEFIGARFPDLRILGDAPETGGPDRPLVVEKHDADGAQDSGAGEYAQYRISLEGLLRRYRVSAHQPDLSDL